MAVALVNVSVADALRIIEEQAPQLLNLMRDKSYEQTPLGQHAAAYLRTKRKRLAVTSFHDYEVCLSRLAKFVAPQDMQALEPPGGVGLIEAFLDRAWGASSPATYNKNLAVIRNFCKFHVIRGNLATDPTLWIERAKKQAVYRTTFSDEHRLAIIAAATERRDRIALRLLLDYGCRKGALQAVQFKHFDHQRKRLTIFTKGGVIRELPIPQPAFWMDLERHILDVEAAPDHFLMAATWSNGTKVRQMPWKPMRTHGMHDWWYRRLTAAGIVSEGTTRGERMHKARHTAGQRVLDKTGNLVAVQKLLGHASISTTADVYLDWGQDQLAETLMSVFAQDDEA